MWWSDAVLGPSTIAKDGATGGSQGDDGGVRVGNLGRVSRLARLCMDPNAIADGQTTLVLGVIVHATAVKRTPVLRSDQLSSVARATAAVLTSLRNKDGEIDSEIGSIPLVLAWRNAASTSASLSPRRSQ